MSKFMASLLKKKAESGKKVQEKLQGEGYLYAGDPAINWGTGGWVRGKLNLVYGPHKCLDANTHIQYQVVDKDGNRQNQKGGTIETLYHRFHGMPRKGKGFYQRDTTVDSTFTITSFDDNGRCVKNDINDVMYSGVKECFELKTLGGKTITSTADHKFLSNGIYYPLSDLKVGDNLSVLSRYPVKKLAKKPLAKRKYLMVKYHPAKNFKTVHDKKTGNDYIYCRVGEHRAVVEADMNNMSLSDYVIFLNTQPQARIDNLTTLGKDMDVHHLNEVVSDNRLENLVAMTKKDHQRLHFPDKIGNISNIISDTIASITPVGPRPTYDIACKDPYNNFLAEGIVVHNSGKTTLAMIAAGAEQKKTDGWIVVFDSEYAHSDPNEVDEETGELSNRAKEARERYEAHGVDVDKLLIISSNQVDSLFEPLPEFEKQCRDGSLNISAIVCDSWAGIQGESSQKKIEEGDIASAGNSFGGNAKTLGPVLQTLLRLSAENAISTFIIQHCIQNMEQYGPRFKLLGGEKLKYLVHMVLFVESVEAADAGLMVGNFSVGEKIDGKELTKTDAKDMVRIGKKIRYRCEKSRRVVEGRQGEFFMNFKDVEFAKPEVSLLNLANNLGIMCLETTPEFEKDGITPVIDKKTGKQKVKQSTTTWVFPVGSPSPFKFQGRAKLLEELRTNKVLFQQVQEACMSSDRTSALAKGESLTSVGDA